MVPLAAEAGSATDVNGSFEDPRWHSLEIENHSRSDWASPVVHAA